MATPVRLIEKEYLLKVLYDEQIPAIYHKDRTEYYFYLERPAKDDLIFRSDRPIDRLRARSNIELKFDYRGKVIVFSVEVLQNKNQLLTCTVPEFLYKNLDRAFSRVAVPPEMKVQFTFQGDRYNLSFPKIQQFDSEELGQFFQNTDPRNLTGLIEQMATWIKKFATGYRLVIFKDVKPATTEERVIAETGKTLYLPSIKEGFPLSDPFPRKRLITENIFHRYLESIGVGQAFLDNTCARFIKAKADEGILSDAWIPILFQEYVIGYIRIWVDVEGYRPFDYAVIDTMYQFAKVLAYSLEINGYFEQGKVKNSAFEGNVIDVSASGLLFSYPQSAFSSSLLPDSKLAVTITTPDRDTSVNAAIVRRFKDDAHGYFGCQFEDMPDDDLRYLFEYIYGKPFTEFDAKFLAGQV